MSTRRTQYITAEDLYRIQLITDAQISPDGQHIVFCIARADQRTQKRHSNLWIVSTDGKHIQQFTYGDQVDSRPRWSPDGNEIAFTSDRGDESQSQIYVIPVHGGEARPLTDLRGQLGAFEWSPDRKQLVLQFLKKDKEAIEREENEGKIKLGVVSRRITRVFYKLDGVGFLPKERWHMWIIDACTGRARQLTDSDVYDEWSPRWSPDAREIVFLSNRSHDPDIDVDAIDLFAIPAEGGEPRKIEAPAGWKWNPVFSPDGKWLAYLGQEGRGQWWKNTGLWVVPADGSGHARNLTAEFDSDVSCVTGNDLLGLLPTNPPVWSNDSRRLFFQVSRHGSTVLKSVALDGKASSLQTVRGAPGVVGTFGFDREQSKLAYFHANMADPGQIWVQDMTMGDARQLTHVNEDLLQACDLGSIEEVWIKGPAGNDLQGWILKPPDFDASREYPAILQIHGGPETQYGNLFVHEFYYLAANGYVVFFCNPRGGQGYGEAHTKAIRNNWGTADYEDLMAWVDFVEQKPYVNSDRMGVTGGSYGGFMTNWIIGHTDRFKAAITRRSISNMISNYGSRDLNGAIEVEFGNEHPWENVEIYWRQSPLKYIGNAKTPTLVIHSEQDMRCAIEQGEQMFIALKKLGVETEMIRYPEEGHSGGRTDRLVDRLKHILRWFDYYLKEEV